MAGFFSKFFGAGASSPADTASIEACAAALAAIDADSARIESELSALAETRKEMLLGTAKDSEIVALDIKRDRLDAAIDALDDLRPQFVARLSELQSEERQALLQELITQLRARELEVDAAMQHGVEAFGAYRLILDQLRAAGFEHQARGLAEPPPANGVALVVSAEDLDRWRAMRERHAAHTSGLWELQPSVAPHFEPKRRMIETGRVTLPASGVVEPAAAKTRRPLKTVDGEIAFGFSKLVALRSGIEISGEQLIAGDEFIAATADAKALVESGAAEIVARGEIDNAAE